MKRQKFQTRVIFFAIVMVLINGHCQRSSEEEDQSVATQSSLVLKQVGDDYWEYLLEESIYLRFKFGLKIEKLPDMTYAYAKSYVDFATSLLERLEKVKPEELTHEEELSFGILKWELTNAVDSLEYYWLNFPVTPYNSYLPYIHRVYTNFVFKNTEDLEHYMRLMQLYPPLIGSLQDILQEQLKKGIVLPKEEMALVIPFHASFIKSGEENLFFVVDTRLEAIDGEAKENFRQKNLEVIETEILPPLESLVSFMKGEYSEKAPDTVGLWQYPGGSEYYQFLIKVHTTLDLSPAEIHELGQSHLKSNYEKLDEVRESIGFEGELEEFLQFLRTDSRFFADTAEGIGERLNSYVAAMDEKIDDYFLRRPQAPYGVQRLAPELEGAMTFGYYDAPSATKPKGLYYYNGSNPSERTLLDAEGLVYHELVPGHHFHIATQSENEALPEYRREYSNTGFTEGWAEYASWLGKEMGLYQDPYSLAGRYMMDIFLTTRLVVDTGMNYMQWPRSKAVEFMKENVVESDTQIHSETLRYSVDIPAQALGYKLGSIKMAELRQKAEGALGDKFDIKKYHEAILGSGALPLPILEKHIDWFIKKELTESD